MSQKSALGKGLASLFPTAEEEEAPSPQNQGDQKKSKESSNSPDATEKTGVASNKDRHPGISFVPLSDIRVNPFQPRREFDETALEELAQSIQANGVVQPLVVRRTSDGYELIAGERRLRAARRAGLKQVPVVLRRSTDRESLELSLVENVQRQDLNCVEHALAYFQLMQEFSLTQEEISRRVGKDRATVANYLRLLKLPEEVLEELRAERLSFGHGKAIASIEDEGARLRIGKKVIKEGLSVRSTEELINKQKQKNSSESSSPDSDRGSKGDKNDTIRQRLATLADELTRLWSAKVELKGNEKKGRIVLHYQSPDELERLLTGLQTQTTDFQVKTNLGAETKWQEKPEN